MQYCKTVVKCNKRKFKYAKEKHLKIFARYLDVPPDLFAVGESSIVCLRVLWSGLFWPLSLFLGIHPIQKDALSPKNCSHHSQRPSPAPHLHALSISTRIPAEATRNFRGGRARVIRQKLMMPTRLRQTQSPNEKKETRGMQLQGLPVQETVRLTAAVVAPLLMSSQTAQRCRSTVNSSQKARRLTQLWNVSSRMVQGNDRSAQIWQQINPLVRFFTLSALLGGEVCVCGGRGWGAGGKRRGREEGRPKLRVGQGVRDGCQYSFFFPLSLLSPAVSHTEHSGSSLQQSGVVAGKAARSTNNSWAFSKNNSLANHLSGSTPRSHRDAEWTMPERRRMGVRFLIFAQPSSLLLEG